MGQAISSHVVCPWCNTPHLYTGTGECRHCWQLSKLMKEDFDLAKKMLKQIEMGN